MAKLFKINPDSIVVGDGGGHLYCTTTPEHPGAIDQKDHPGYVQVARVVLENQLGRLLKEGEEPHHKNGDPADNSPGNLELKTHGGHAKEHAHEKKMWKKSPRTKPGRKASIADLIRFLALR